MANDLDNSLAFLIMHIGNLVRVNATAGLAGSNVHFGQSRVLYSLEKSGILSQGQITRELNITPATVTNMVKRLEASGYVRRGHDKCDDRVVNVTLTPEGEAVAKVSLRALNELETMICFNITDKELDVLYALLERIRNTLSGR